MKASKVLDMLNKGMYDELELYLRDEIYNESLTRSKNTDVKKRYTAMKKYFNYTNSSRKACQKPHKVEYGCIEYTSFCNSYSLVLTIELPGALELFDSINDGTYPDVTGLINCDGIGHNIDFTKVLAEAKSKGYKLTKSEIHSNKYLLHYDGAYFRIGLLDITYGIINDGKEATVYHKEGNSGSPMTIVNELGYAVVMPVRIEGGPDEESIVIEI
jgi:hypothetical protein